MLRAAALGLTLGASAFGVLTLAACGHSAYAVRSVPSIAADTVGKPVSRLQDAFGEPRKIDRATSKWSYVWFLPENPAGAPTGFHGCEMEVSVDPRSQRVLGYSLSNIGWSNCREVQRKIRIAER
ncbi:MAG TPA: hypothetical protein VN692_23235 [Steroidobacteraceae bacterium]|nr:hypothetical protein [Steroidobacteraceae bacterium]